MELQLVSPDQDHKQEVAIGIQEFPSIIGSEVPFGSEDTLRFLQNESKLTNQLQRHTPSNGKKMLNQDVSNVLSINQQVPTDQNSRMDSSKHLMHPRPQNEITLQIDQKFNQQQALQMIPHQAKQQMDYGNNNQSGSGTVAKGNINRNYLSPVSKKSSIKIMLTPAQQQQSVKILDVNIDQIVENQRRIIDLNAGVSLNQQLSNEFSNDQTITSKVSPRPTQQSNKAEQILITSADKQNSSSAQQSHEPSDQKQQRPAPAKVQHFQLKNKTPPFLQIEQKLMNGNPYQQKHYKAGFKSRFTKSNNQRSPQNLHVIQQLNQNSNQAKFIHQQRTNSLTKFGVQGTGGQIFAKKKSVKYSPNAIAEENSGGGTKRSDESVPVPAGSYDEPSMPTKKTEQTIMPEQTLAHDASFVLNKQSSSARKIVSHHPTASKDESKLNVDSTSNPIPSGVFAKRNDSGVTNFENVNLDFIAKQEQNNDRLIERRPTSLVNPSPEGPRLQAAYSPIEGSRKTGSSNQEASFQDDERQRVIRFDEGSFLQDSAHGQNDLNNGHPNLSNFDNQQVIKNLQEYSGLIHDSSLQRLDQSPIYIDEQIINTTPEERDQLIHDIQMQIQYGDAYFQDKGLQLNRQQNALVQKSNGANVYNKFGAKHYKNRKTLETKVIQFTDMGSKNNLVSLDHQEKNYSIPTSPSKNSTLVIRNEQRRMNSNYHPSQILQGVKQKKKTLQYSPSAQFENKHGSREALSPFRHDDNSSDDFGQQLHVSGSKTILSPDTKNPVHYLISKPLKQKAFKYDQIPSNLVVKANKVQKENFKKMQQLRGTENTDDISAGNVTLYKEFKANQAAKNSNMDNTFHENEDQTKNVKKHTIDVGANEAQIDHDLRASRSLVPWEQSVSPRQSHQQLQLDMQTLAQIKGQSKVIYDNQENNKQYMGHNKQKKQQQAFQQKNSLQILPPITNSGIYSIVVQQDQMKQELDTKEENRQLVKINTTINKKYPVTTKNSKGLTTKSHQFDMNGIVIEKKKIKRKERIQKVDTMHLISSPKENERILKSNRPSNARNTQANIYSKMVSGLSVVSGSAIEESSAGTSPVERTKKNIKVYPPIIGGQKVSVQYNSALSQYKDTSIIISRRNSQQESQESINNNKQQEKSRVKSKRQSKKYTGRLSSEGSQQLNDIRTSQVTPQSSLRRQRSKRASVSKGVGTNQSSFVLDNHDKQVLIDLGLDIANQSIISTYQVKEEIHQNSINTPIDKNQMSASNFIMNTSIMANEARATFLEKQIQKQRQLKERYKSSLSRYSPLKDGRRAPLDDLNMNHHHHHQTIMTSRKPSKRKLKQVKNYSPRKDQKAQEIYLPQSLDKITYQHQHSPSSRVKSFETNTMKNSTKIKIKPHEMDTVVNNAKNNILSFPVSNRSYQNPFSNTRMRGALNQNSGNPIVESYKVSVQLRSKSTLQQPMAVTGMTLRMAGETFQKQQGTGYGGSFIPQETMNTSFDHGMRAINNEGFAINYGSGDLASTRGDMNIFMQHSGQDLPQSALQYNSGSGAPITGSPLGAYIETTSLPLIPQKGQSSHKMNQQTMMKSINQTKFRIPSIKTGLDNGSGIETQEISPLVTGGHAAFASTLHKEGLNMHEQNSFGPTVVDINNYDLGSPHPTTNQQPVRGVTLSPPTINAKVSQITEATKSHQGSFTMTKYKDSAFKKKELKQVLSLNQDLYHHMNQVPQDQQKQSSPTARKTSIDRTKPSPETKQDTNALIQQIISNKSQKNPAVLMHHTLTSKRKSLRNQDPALFTGKTNQTSKSQKKKNFIKQAINQMNVTNQISLDQSSKNSNNLINLYSVKMENSQGLEFTQEQFVVQGEAALEKEPPKIIEKDIKQFKQNKLLF